MASSSTRFARAHLLAPTDGAAHDDARLAKQQCSRTQRNDCATCGTETMQQGPVHALLLRQVSGAMQGSAPLHQSCTATALLLTWRYTSEWYVTLSTLLEAAMTQLSEGRCPRTAVQSCQSQVMGAVTW